ncbi:MAG: hypothetical protein II863_09700 [Kiritimatiellae bacterium]|nr:hypothetical protein [Kiritimatiellia bacterium]
MSANNDVAAATNCQCRLVAKISHVSGIRKNTIVLVREDRTWDFGIVTIVPDSTGLEAGDVVAVEGRTFYNKDLKHLCILANNVDILRKEELPPARQGNFHVVRKGRIHGRHISLVGTIPKVVREKSEDGQVVSVFGLTANSQVAICRFPGDLPKRMVNAGRVKVVGCVFEEWNDAGTICSSRLEIASIRDMELLDIQPTNTWQYAAIGAGAVLAATLVVLFVFWLKVRRERFASQAIAVERKRMAMDLHDTIEQHLAGVKMLLAAALGADGIPEKPRQMLFRANDMLAYAKGEVRTAVMNLRGEEDGRSLEEILREIASGVEKSGAARVRLALRGLPQHLPGRVIQNLSMIVREAVTNAIKHAKASNIVFAYDKPVLRVLNDGSPFDRAKALGPSTGHYGLAGMEERAAKIGSSLSFGVDGNWTYVKVEVKE